MFTSTLKLSILIFFLLFLFLSAFSTSSHALHSSGNSFFSISLSFVSYYGDYLIFLRVFFVLVDGVDVVGTSQYDEVLQWTTTTRRSLADETTANSSLLLAEKRTRRKDPLDHFNLYTGGWNISNKHYIAVCFSFLHFFAFLLLASRNFFLLIMCRRFCSFLWGMFWNWLEEEKGREGKVYY